MIYYDFAEKKEKNFQTGFVNERNFEQLFYNT